MTGTEKQALAQRIALVRERIALAAHKAGRDPSEITWIAASKMNDADRVRAAIAAGVSVCGENRVQELLEKWEQNAYQGATLHFIGPLQTNKVKYLVGKVELIQSVDTVRLAQEIAKQAEKQKICQKILIEVNIGEEKQKRGIPPEQLETLLQTLSAYPYLSIKGLMCIPPAGISLVATADYFRRMHQLFIDILVKKYDNVSMDFLSMGMSSDYETAIACGANMVRIGTGIFGARDSIARHQDGKQ